MWSDETTPLEVLSNGSVSWWSHYRAQSFCELDVTFLPFDTHICNLTFGSYIKNMIEVRTEL